ncbi:MAG TPA: hypothetical protein VFD66_03985 [Verrucomicrobiae bacterium]|nr:hypothetical protein [Verrucomicrobiae bacterium]
MKKQVAHSEFMSRLLYQIHDDEPYWVMGTPATPEIVAQMV